jgi:hypothetical protein
MIRYTKLITVLLLMMTTPALGVDWLVLPERSNDVTVRAKTVAEKSAANASQLIIRTAGSDPHVIGRLATPLAKQDCILQFDYFSTTGIDAFSVVFGPPIVEAHRIDLPSLLIAEGWQTVSFDLESRTANPLPAGSRLLRFDFGTQPDRDIQIRNVQVRPRTEKETRAQSIALANTLEKKRRATAFNDYLNQPHQNLIASVAVTKEEVTIGVSPDLLASLGEDLQPVKMKAGLELIEYRSHDAVYSKGTVVDFQVADQKFSLPRHTGGYDRLCSSWQIRSKDNGHLSARVYPSQIDAFSTDHAPQSHQPKSQKGLTCLSHRGPQNDFAELGIHNVTINFVLSRFLRDRDAPGRVRIEAPGDPVFFDPSAFRGYDGLMNFAREHDMVVSAVVLIPSPKNQMRRSPLIHPESNGGTYVMPDLTTRRGALVYQSVLSELAGRYRNHEKAPGGISNWIVHNEIDFHTIWTNMGKQPRELVAETYYRSMRVIDSVAKQYNPHARVFASLTHHWTDAKPESWSRFSPRWLLETLQKLSRKEGDFDWGVAYHPYPQSLFAKVPWNDRRVTDQVDSPLVTMQNLEVLGQFLQRPEMLRSGGQMRGVILSEQGFHSHSYDEADQEAQAAALCWAMQRVKAMPWVESFIYHRWIDHPHEGGLMLGLRTLPTEDHPAGERKKSWHVFQAIGTDTEPAVTKDLELPAQRR